MTARGSRRRRRPFPCHIRPDARSTPCSSRTVRRTSLATCGSRRGHRVTEGSLGHGGVTGSRWGHWVTWVTGSQWGQGRSRWGQGRSRGAKGSHGGVTGSRSGHNGVAVVTGGRGGHSMSGAIATVNTVDRTCLLPSGGCVLGFMIGAGVYDITAINVSCPGPTTRL